MKTHKPMKPCPFCGRRSLVESDLEDSPKINTQVVKDVRIWRGYCVECHAKGPSTTVSEQKAVGLWNKRVSDVLSELSASTAAATGIPKRILLGDERGELPSAQDDRKRSETMSDKHKTITHLLNDYPEVIDSLREILSDLRGYKQTNEEFYELLADCYQAILMVQGFPDLKDRLSKHIHEDAVEDVETIGYKVDALGEYGALFWDPIQIKRTLGMMLDFRFGMSMEPENITIMNHAVTGGQVVINVDPNTIPGASTTQDVVEELVDAVRRYCRDNRLEDDFSHGETEES